MKKIENLSKESAVSIKKKKKEITELKNTVTENQLT